MKTPTPRLIVLATLAALLISIGCSSSREEEVKKSPQRFVGLILKDPNETEFLKAVLRSMNLPYTAETTPNGEKVEWPSTDPVQEQEIQNRVSQYWFIATQCKGMQLPSPDKPAAPRLSC